MSPAIKAISASISSISSKQAGHTVTGCDLGLFDGCAWEDIVPADRELAKDVRADHACKISPATIASCILRRISNDPMGEVDAAATYAINRDASIRIAQLAKKAGVPRYLFAASCSVYGAGHKLDLDENDPLNPLTAYAKSKIETEQAVSSWRIAISPLPIFATRPLMATRRCYASTLSSTIYWPAPSRPARSASCPTDRRGGRSFIAGTSPAPSLPS